jgi:membrane protein
VSAITERGLRPKAKAIADGFVENDLLTYASAISFQILSAIVPFLLFAFGVLGYLGLEDVWRNELAPDIKSAVSGPAFQVIDDAVEKALGSKNAFWVTAGFLIALWQVSGAVRAVMGVLNRIHEEPTERSWGRRMFVSFALALVIGGCCLAAIATVVLTPLLYGDVGTVGDVLTFVLRWAIAAGFLAIAIAVPLHFAPERNQPLEWVTSGSLLVLGGWVLMSIGFGVYLREIADYGSIFGGLATVVVLIAYLYAAAVVFLGGVQIDSLVRNGR